MNKHICTIMLIIISGITVANNVEIDAQAGKSFNRNILGHPLNYVWGKSDILNRTMTRSTAVGSRIQTLNWKQLWNDFDYYATLPYLISDRDNASESLFQVNMRGIGQWDNEGIFAYTDTSESTMLGLAGDWVQYVNNILPNYSIGDALAVDDARIVQEIEWMPKLLTIGSPRTNKVTYWEIGNEEEHGNYWASASEYVSRYKAITNAMKSVDPTIKVGPGIISVSPNDTSHIVRSLLQDSTATVDAIFYHTYTNFGQYYNPNPDSPSYSNDLAAAEAGLRNLYQNQKIYYDQIVATLVADGRDVNEIELINSEYDALGWSWTSASPTMFSALANAEWVFTFAELGVDGACHWANTYSSTSDRTPWPIHKAYAAMNKYMGDTLLLRNADNNIRIYATKDTLTGRVVVWALNFSNDINYSVPISLNNIGTIVSKTLMRLGTEDAGDNSLHSRNIQGTVDVDWRITDVTGNSNYANLLDFNLDVPKASIVLLVLEPGLEVNIAIDNDATVFKNHANSANNYGSETTLMLYNATPSSYEQMIYLQATTLIDELSGYSSSDILSATVYLYDYHNYRDAGARIYVADAQWDEVTINGNNAPAYSTSYTNTVFWPKQLGWVSFDATNEVKDWLSGAVSDYGFVIKMNPNSTYNIRFYSSEYSVNTALRPYIRILVSQGSRRCSDFDTLHIIGDINRDCVVDFLDFALLAQAYSACTDPEDSECDNYWK